ncbi:hypothetical protein PDESU_02628 [Pontiella desulfatans]|uniref:Beta-hexosaminidase bacterial type N-terminal domain-containing protein n=1 Tax=Pontiella desulfatans TaxID=2750659 RepID=A0A6C2U3D4_PONDE|nr:DUF4838 domain-containing protein [Pontiella desulfatans]VGO14071.1 hypothetical protein PDESU_02628 [Pontiella desulfatans]
MKRTIIFSRSRMAFGIKFLLAALVCMHARTSTGAALTIQDVVQISYSTPAKQQRVVRFAAEELQSYLNQMGGAVKAIGQIDADAAPARIHLQLNPASELRWDGYRITTDRGRIIIEAAQARGVLYGVYELLERCGCSFFYPEEAWHIVPTIKALPEINLTHEPQVEWRGLALYGVRSDELPICQATLDWMAKQRFNYVLLSQDRPAHRPGLAQEVFFAGKTREALLPEIMDRGFIINLGEHNTHEYLDRNALFEVHPDWFAEIQGRRVKGQICYSNQEAMKYYAEALVAYVKNNTWIDIVGTWPLDGGGYCKCEPCSNNPYAVYEGIKLVAQEVAKARPNLMVEHLAYTPETLTPPEQPIPSNMTVLYCPNLESKKELERGWIENKTSSGIYQFEYLLADNWRARGWFWLRPDFANWTGSYLAQNGFRGTVSLYLPIQVWWKGAFNYHFLRQSLWHKQYDVQQGLAAYIKAYYPGYEKQVGSIFQQLLEQVQAGGYKRMRSQEAPPAVLLQVRDQAEALRKETLALQKTVKEAEIALRIQRIADYLEGMVLYYQYMARREAQDLETLLAFSAHHEQQRTGISVQHQYLQWRMGYFKPVKRDAEHGVLLGMCRNGTPTALLDAGNAVTTAGKFQITLVASDKESELSLKTVELLEDGRVVAHAQPKGKTAILHLETHFDMGRYQLRCVLTGQGAAEVYVKKIPADET